VLHDHGRGTEALEIRRERERRVHVQPVVERHLLALDEDLRASQHPGPARPSIQGPALMRVLAVPEVSHLVEREPDERRHRGIVRGEPPRDRGVVGRRVGERLGGQPPPHLERQTSLGPDGVEDLAVARRAHDDADGGEVLRGRADHRRSADVDLLDHVVLPGPARHGLAERVQVHDDEIDRLDVVLGEL
jgi:hypothetical protein